MRAKTREKMHIFVKIGAAVLAFLIFAGYILSSFLF